MYLISELQAALTLAVVLATFTWTTQFSCLDMKESNFWQCSLLFFFVMQTPMVLFELHKWYCHMATFLALVTKCFFNTQVWSLTIILCFCKTSLRLIAKKFLHFLCHNQSVIFCCSFLACKIMAVSAPQGCGLRHSPVFYS
jgi:hypothetical protein